MGQVDMGGYLFPPGLHRVQGVICGKRFAIINAKSDTVLERIYWGYLVCHSIEQVDIEPRCELVMLSVVSPAGNSATLDTTSDLGRG